MMRKNKLLDAEIAGYGNPLFKKHYHKLLDAKVAEYVAQNELTKGKQKKKLERERLKQFKDNKQERLLNAYRAWFFTRFHATTGAELLFVRREYEYLGQLVTRGLILSPAHLEICLLLQQELKRLELKLRNEAAASVARNAGNKESATRLKFNQLLKEGERHIESSELFHWEFHSTLEEETAKGVGTSEKKELGVKEQKDKGLEEEEEVKKSAIKQHLNKAEEEVKKSAMEQLLNEASMKKILKERMGTKEDAIKREYNRVIEEGKEHLNNLESFDQEIRPWEEKLAKQGEASMKVGKRWSLQEKVIKLIDQTLEHAFGLGEKSETVICSKEEYGDYQCENVLSIWPKLLEKGTELKEPKCVGETIKMELKKRSDMIEGTPCVRSFGFVTFKLSGKWMAKSLNRMVRYGIDTWAPKLPLKGVIVETPDYESSFRNSNVGPEADIIRSNLIRETFIRMLEYSEVFVSKDEFLRDALCNVPDDIWSFLIEERDGDVVLSANVEGKLESLNFGKRGIQDIKDSLKILWCELKYDRADWIVCLNPVRHQEYVEMCHTAAEHAGWIPTAEHRGLSFAGYQTHVEAGKLVYLLENALTRCNSLVKQGKTPEYTAERVFCCALGYEYLKKPRLLDCTFNVDEMLNEKGNTFLYLLNTKSQVLSVLANSRKHIELKNVSELILEEVKILEIDKGRALGFHLLLFTQVLEESCLSVLPHILCRYLKDLCQKFTGYNSAFSCLSEVGSVTETSRLILCEATAAVMEKCFHLLGITPVSIIGESLIEKIKLLSDLKKHMGPKDPTVITSMARDPPKHLRFEITAIRPKLTKFESGKLFGRILVHDKHGMLSDGWMPTYFPDFGNVSLFSSEWYNSLEMMNHGLVPIGNPDARHWLPLTTSTLRMYAELIFTNESEDLFYHLHNRDKVVELDFQEIKGDGVSGRIVLDGKDMQVFMYCIVLKDAVDTSVEVMFRAKGLRCKVEGHIQAYYGSEFPYAAGDDVIKRNFMAELLKPSIITAGQIPLTRSKIAVPKNGSLMIEAKLVNVDTGNVILSGCYEFPTKIRKNSKLSICGIGCFLDLKVHWKYA